MVIAFHYPPDNSSTGVLRTYKFTEYLLKHGWRSHVISVPDALYASRNPPGVDVIPAGVTVERAWACDVKQMLGVKGVYPAWLGIPDRYWPWFFSGRRRAAQAIRERQFDALYSTFPVPTAHLIALSLKRRSGIPWIADFRDPWVEDSLPPFRRWLESKLERAVIESADRVICNTPAMHRFFVKRYSEVPESRFVTITNGYDEGDLSRIVPEPASKFHILYPGTIDGENRNPRSLFAGLRRALDKGWLKAEDLIVTFLGCGSYAESAQFKADLGKHRLEPHVHIVKDRVPYREALAKMAGADVVVVLSEHLGGSDQGSQIQEWTTMQVPAKVYEYMRLGRPMLALVSGGAVQDLLELTGAGSPISPDDSDAIGLALKRFYDKRASAPHSLGVPTAKVARFSREHLTSLLASELDTLSTAHQQ